jgi:hypothetical protein
MSTLAFSDWVATGADAPKTSPDATATINHTAILMVKSFRVIKVKAPREQYQRW